MLRDRYRVLRFDTRGHGKTTAPAGVYSLEQMAEDLHGLLSGLGIAETHFVGLSMGGMIGQVFALKYPAMIQSLVLCDTTSRYPAAAASVWRDRIRHGREQGDGADRRAHLAALVHRAVPIPPDRSDDARRGDDPQHAAPRIRGLLPRHPADRRDRPAHGASLSRPRDRRRGGRRHAGVDGARHPRRAPGSELAILRSASHLSNLEQPEEFNRVLLRFSRQGDGAGRALVP